VGDLFRRGILTVCYSQDERWRYPPGWWPPPGLRYSKGETPGVLLQSPDRNPGRTGFSHHVQPSTVLWLPAPVYSRVVTIPHWSAMFVTGILPICAIYRFIRSSGPSNDSLCPACGYDLRATPDRCPECGTVAVAPPPPREAPQPRADERSDDGHPPPRRCGVSRSARDGATAGGEGSDDP
jgi:hypothetical protein